MKLSRNARLGGGLGLMTIALLVGGVIPSWHALHANRVRIASVRAHAGAVTDHAEELRIRDERLRGLIAFAHEHTRPMPAQHDMAGLVRSISTFLDTVGVTSREIAAGQPVKTGAISALPISLTMKADFLSACAVVAHVESFPRLIRIRRLKVSRDRAGDGGLSTSAPIAVELLLEAVTCDSCPDVDALAYPADARPKFATPEKGGSEP